MRMRSTVVVLAAALAAAPACAQDAGWDTTLSLHGFIPGVTAGLPTPSGPVTIEESVGDLLDAADFAAFGAIEARRGRWSLIGDLTHADAGAGEDAPLGLLHDRADLDTRLLSVTAYGLYRLAETPAARFELGGGLRFLDISADLALAPGASPGLSFARSGSFVDPVLATRASFALGPGWSAELAGDLGGFGLGTDLSWQVVGTLGYDVGERWTLIGGYRALDIDTRLDGSDFDLRLSGPVLGARFRF